MNQVAFLSPVQEQLKLVEVRLHAQADDRHPDLRAALEQILAAGGKRIRPSFVLLLGNMLGAPEERLVTLGASVELLHTATLVHDDLIDGSLLRRGLPTLNARWSPAATVLTGDFLFARAAKLAADTDHLPLMKMFADTLAIIVNGELTQMFSARGVISRENYSQRIYSKTASLFELIGSGAAVLSPAEEDIVDLCRQFGYETGMAFQIVDDILDFSGEPTTMSAGIASWNPSAGPTPWKRQWRRPGLTSTRHFKKSNRSNHQPNGKRWKVSQSSSWGGMFDGANRPCYNPRPFLKVQNA